MPDRIAPHFFRRYNGRADVIVSVQIDRAGNLLSREVVRKSGDRRVDAEALKAIDQTEFEPLPNWYVGGPLDFVINMESVPICYGQGRELNETKYIHIGYFDLSRVKADLDEKFRASLESRIGIDLANLKRFIGERDGLYDEQIGQVVRRIARELGLDVVFDKSGILADSWDLTERGTDITDVVLKKLDAKPLVAFPHKMIQDQNP